MTALSLRNLTKRYPGETGAAVEGLTLDVPSGTVAAILGPSGSGKTTVMKMIAGLAQPSAGDVLFDGRSVVRDEPERRGAAMVFQQPLLFPHMSVAGNVGFALRMQRLSKAGIARQVAEMLDLVQLPGLGGRRPQDLSGGQQQRVALARALIGRPKILLLDEPLANLDPHLRAGMRDLIGSVQRQTGITTLIVTHDQQEAVVMADRIALILEGRLRQFGIPDAFYRRPADITVARFFGAANIVQGTVRDGGFDCALGRLRLPGSATEGTACLTFRPESVRLGGGDADGTGNAFGARIEARQFLGTQTRLILRAGGVRIEALLPPWAAEGLDEGGPVRVSLPPESLWVLPPG